MGRKRVWTAVWRVPGFSQIKGQTVKFMRKDLSLADGLKSILFIGSFIRRGTRVRARPSGAGLAVAEGVFAGETERHQVCNLRVRTGGERRCLGPVPFRILSLRDHLSHLRRGSNFTATESRNKHRTG